MQKDVVDSVARHIQLALPNVALLPILRWNANEMKHIIAVPLGSDNYRFARGKRCGQRFKPRASIIIHGSASFFWKHWLTKTILSLGQSRASNCCKERAYNLLPEALSGKRGASAESLKFRERDVATHWSHAAVGAWKNAILWHILGGFANKCGNLSGGLNFV